MMVKHIKFLSRRHSVASLLQILIPLLLGLVWMVEAAAQRDVPLVLVLNADGAVTPAMAQYLERGIRTAQNRGAEVIIFQLNTPGGSVTTMNQMVQILLASPVPVVVYVAPRGAMAGSAGTLITLAGHVAAMAPETAIGAASPIDSQGQDLTETAAAKEKNILRATARSLAERRGPDAMAIAEDTIENALAVSANQALEAGMIDFVAVDLQDLLKQLDGFHVTVLNQDTTLNTAISEIQVLQPSFIEQILQLLTYPNIIFLLINIGVYAIIIELASPGGWVAGFLGVVCLALAIYGLGILPVNWFGLVFLLAAFVLFILDVKAPTHGALTATGIGSLIIGALVLFNSPGTPSFQRVSIPLVVITAAVTAVGFVFLLSFALRAQKIPVRTGSEGVAGMTGVAKVDISPHGTVQVASELWSANLEEGEPAIKKGEKVIVTRKEGIHLRVRRQG
jgi:membrane-bound serine protease (ClpP class)